MANMIAMSLQSATISYGINRMEVAMMKAGKGGLSFDEICSSIGWTSSVAGSLVELARRQGRILATSRHMIVDGEVKTEWRYFRRGGQP